jgi:hypothetical protein
MRSPAEAGDVRADDRPNATSRCLRHRGPQRCTGDHRGRDVNHPVHRPHAVGAGERAQDVNGFTEFERLFGGLWTRSPLSFAVRSFFLNGGGVAVIVRLTNNAARATLDLASLQLDASGG